MFTWEFINIIWEKPIPEPKLPKGMAPFVHDPNSLPLLKPIPFKIQVSRN